MGNVGHTEKQSSWLAFSETVIFNYINNTLDFVLDVLEDDKRGMPPAPARHIYNSQLKILGSTKWMFQEYCDSFITFPRPKFETRDEVQLQYSLVYQST